MAYSCLNGRLRSLPGLDEGTKSYVSATPCTLPHGLITTHEVSFSEEPSLVEVNRLKGEIIIDHCWTKVQCSQHVESDIIILMVLTRLRGENIPSLASTLRIRWRLEPNLAIGSKRDSIDEAFPYRKDITLPLNCSSLVANKNLLAIASSSGVIVFQLQDLIVDSDESQENGSENHDRISHDAIPSFRMLNTFVIHAMGISDNYFVAVSGERLGVWSVSKIIDAFEHKSCAAEWSTNLEGRSGRVTCIRISNSINANNVILAICSWDGSAIIFQGGADTIWNRITGPIQYDEHAAAEIENPIWEQSPLGSSQDHSPVFAEIIELSNFNFLGTVLILASAKSAFLRLFLVESGREKVITLSGNDDSKTVEGMARLQNSSDQSYGFAYIDSADKIGVIQKETIRNVFLAGS